MSDQTPSRASTRNRVPSSKKIQSDEYTKKTMEDDEEEEVVVQATPPGRKGSRARKSTRVPDSESEGDSKQGDEGDRQVGDDAGEDDKGQAGNESDENGHRSVEEDEDDDDKPLAAKMSPSTQVKKARASGNKGNALKANDRTKSESGKITKPPTNARDGQRVAQERGHSRRVTAGARRDENGSERSAADTGANEDDGGDSAKDENEEDRAFHPSDDDDKTGMATPPPSSAPASPKKTPTSAKNFRVKSKSGRKDVKKLVDMEAEEDNDAIESEDAEEGYDEHVNETNARMAAKTSGQHKVSETMSDKEESFDDGDVTMENSLSVRVLPPQDVPMSDEEEQQEETIVFSHGGSAAAREFLASFRYDESDPAYARVTGDAIFKWSGICDYAFSIGCYERFFKYLSVGTYAVVDAQPAENAVSYIKQDRVMERSYPAIDIMEIFCFAVAFFQGSDLVNLSRISWRSVDFVKVSDSAQSDTLGLVGSKMPVYCVTTGLLASAFLDKEGKEGVGASGARRGALVTLLEAEAFRLFACLNRLGRMGESNSFKFPLYADGTIAFTTKVVNKDGGGAGGSGPTLISAKGGWQPRRKLGVLEFSDKIPVLDGQGHKDLWKRSEVGMVDILGLPSYSADKLVPDQMVSVLYTITRWKRKAEKAAENLSFNIAALVVLSGPIDRVAAKARLAAPRVDVKSPGSAPRTGKISLKGNNVAGDPSTSTGRDEGVGSAKRAASAANGSPPKKAKKEHAE